jgi:hypothetical protein
MHRMHWPALNIGSIRQVLQPGSCKSLCALSCAGLTSVLSLSTHLTRHSPPAAVSMPSPFCPGLVAHCAPQGLAPSPSTCHRTWCTRDSGGSTQDRETASGARKTEWGSMQDGGTGVGAVQVCQASVHCHVTQGSRQAGALYHCIYTIQCPTHPSPLARLAQHLTTHTAHPICGLRIMPFHAAARLT